MTHYSALGGQLRRLAAPAVPALSADDLRAHLKLDDGSQDAEVNKLLKGVIRHLDGATGVLCRCLITQTWAVDLDGFPPREISIPLPPLQTVEAVSYIDTLGVRRTLVEDADYLVHAGDGGLVEVFPGASFPAVRAQRRAVTIEFTAGYGAAPSDIPDDIINAMKLLCGDAFENRQAQVGKVGMVQFAQNPRVDDLLDKYRNRSF